MADYKRMYHVLFREITKVVERLQEAQRETEDIYIETGEDNITPLNKED